MTDQMSSMMTEDEFLAHLDSLSDDELAHYGKKGMKWGVRKSKGSSTHVSADAARVNKIKARAKKNGFDNLSNDDIAKLNKRSQLISEYKKANPSTLDRGHNATKKALAVVGTAGAVGALGLKAARSEVGKKAIKAILSNLGK